jgi:hypothetical protein
MLGEVGLSPTNIREDYESKERQETRKGKVSDLWRNRDETE